MARVITTQSDHKDVEFCEPLNKPVLRAILSCEQVQKSRETVVCYELLRLEGRIDLGPNPDARKAVLSKDLEEASGICKADTER